jgi:hypothetical protein
MTGAPRTDADRVASFQTALNIWIVRFKTAQQEIRKLESELERSTRLLETVLPMLSDDQLVAAREAVSEGKGTARSS